MRYDVTQEEFRALTRASEWRYDTRPDVIKRRQLGHLPIQIHPSAGFPVGVPYAFMRELSELFETEHINIATDYEADYSELTPGAGPSLWIELLAEAEGKAP